jgi:hypothetical protein
LRKKTRANERAHFALVFAIPTKLKKRQVLFLFFIIIISIFQLLKIYLFGYIHF